MLAIGKDCAEIRKVMANYEFNHMVTVDPITPPFPHNVTVQGPYKPRRTLRLLGNGQM
ncbi:hypothetical protein F441_15885 [Phytophthora nicotianae CJ01A1]|uniref:Uncharacterized protein n=1 Tax=Phytophthora nicotianae CJ01A1 TaxID=1317063 RepID=W2WC35_PHYNI|nr:hypothetical protein F441_15885 [Phytophthora nicotianae CJ01A1]